MNISVVVTKSVAARSVTSSYGDTKSTEQLAKSNGSNANKENTRRAIQTELRVRIGRELMVDLIEIAKPLTRLKSNRPNQSRATFCRPITSGTLKSVSSYSGVAQNREIFVSHPNGSL